MAQVFFLEWELWEKMVFVSYNFMRFFINITQLTFEIGIGVLDSKEVTTIEAR